MQTPVSDELYREFLKTFQLLHDPVGLADSNLMTSPLVRQTMQRQANLLPHQALHTVFQELLAILIVENRDYADLLQGRFWEGKQIEEMLTAERPVSMSKRTFSNYQRNAIVAFALLFLQAEDNQQRQVDNPVVAIVENNRLEPQVSLSENPAQMKQSTPQELIGWGERANPARQWWRWSLLLLLSLLVIGVMNRERFRQFFNGTLAGISANTLFEDDFETGSGKWNPDSDVWSIQVDDQGNHYYCGGKSSIGYSNTLAGSTTWQDYTLELDFKIVTSAQYGSSNILLRTQAEMFPLYLVDIFAEEDGGGVALARESPDYTTLDQTLSRLPTQVWTPLRIELYGAAIKVFIADEALPFLQATDPNPIEQGGIGLSTGFSQSPGTNRWEICFDNIRVTRNQSANQE